MTHLINVGNSLGIRIPKAIITQLGFKKDTDLEFKITDRGLLISPKLQKREGWAEAFEPRDKIIKKKLIMDEYIENEFDKDEWVW